MPLLYFTAMFMTSNCTVAKLQLNDKLYDLIAKTCRHLSWCWGHNFGAGEFFVIFLTY